MITGSSEACKQKAANWYRYFDVRSDLGREGSCKCGRPEDPTGVNTQPHYDCAREFTIDKTKLPSYDDLLETAHEWCRSDLVPEEKRVPEVLRGFYWMKDLPLTDIAFCPSLAEWNATTRTARMPVWASFVVGRESHEEVPALILGVSGKGTLLTTPGEKLMLGNTVLIYSIQFTDDTFKKAIITPNAPVFNTVTTHHMTELDQTPDGRIVSEKRGDIWDRPSWALGVISIKNYYAVRVMDDDGTIHEERAKMMREAENSDITYMRYAPTC